MTKKQARALILLLALKRIPFQWSRKEGVYVVSFDERYLFTIHQAAGA